MRADQERLCSVLRDTISLLCKSSLRHQRHISVQGLVAITVDDDDVLVVQVNDNIGQTPHDACVTCGQSRLSLVDRSSRKLPRTPSPETKVKLTKSSDCDVNQLSSECRDTDPQNEDADVLVKSEDDMTFAVVKTEHVDSEFLMPSDTREQIALSANCQNSEQPVISLPEPDDAPEQDFSFLLQDNSSTQQTAAPTLHYEPFSAETISDMEPRPFVCLINNCNKRFKRNDHLRNHELLHTGEKPYKCPLCSHRCNRKGNLQKHIKKHGANWKPPK